MQAPAVNSQDHSLPLGKRANFVIAGLMILSVFLTGCTETRSPAIEAVRSAIDRSAGYLARRVDADGMFEYRINVDPTIEVTERYNILRHAGALYAMSASQAKEAYYYRCAAWNILLAPGTNK